MKKILIPLGMILATVAVADDRDEMESLFRRAQAAALEKVEAMRACSFSDQVDDELARWMVDASRVIADDMRASDHAWTNRDLPVCGMTALEPAADVRLSYNQCAREVSSLPQAAKLLLRMTAMHLGERERGQLIANAIWDQGGECSQGTQLVTGGLFSCLLYDETVTCWGDNESHTTVPSLTRPVSLAAGHNHVCAVDAYGVHCWGSSGSVNEIPGLWEPYKVSGGQSSSCALDVDGARCWGLRSHYLSEAPLFNEPTQIDNAERHACVLDQGNVACWGDDYNDAHEAPAITDATQIAVVDGASCALVNGSVQCWGAIDEDPLPRRDDIFAFDIAGSTHHGYYGCALFQNRATCFGSSSDGSTTVPQLRKPSQISTNMFHACALDDVGVKCWGSNQFGQTEVPSHLQVLR